MRTFFTLLVVWFAASPAVAAETTFSGFVDAAYFFNTADTNGEFGLDQFEIDVEHSASDRTLLRADVEWIKDGEDYVAQLEQAFMTYELESGLAFTLGKFNAPIGFELLDAPDMYQYSHSLVFDYGVPTNLTGASVGFDFGSGFDLVGHVSNGWDRQTADANLTWGGRLGWTDPGDDGLSAGASAISGKEETPDQLTRTVFDIDLTYTRGRFLFGGEYNMGTATTSGDVDSEWMGFLVMGNVALSEKVALTVRYDYFDDEDGYAFDLVNGEVQTRQAIVVSPSIVLDDGLGALAELRIDMSDQDAFLDRDGKAIETSTSIAFEVTYSW